jgi:hypothetical protein
MTNARGKHAFGFCDKTGFRYPLDQLVDEYENGVKNGFRVGYDVVDPDQPQNFLGRVRIDDPQSLLNPRPDRQEPESISLLGGDPFTTGSSGSSVITVKEINHGRSDSDTVRFRGIDNFDGITKSVVESASGYSITKVDSDTYTFTVSDTAIIGNTSGGGSLASAGPVTPLA